jgi:hypothetical protein
MISLASMRIHAVCVCVNYADLLHRSIQRWQVGTERFLVVTSSADKETRDLCRYHNAELHVTDVFYECGAKFNKGAAMSEAVLAHNLRAGADWLLTVDADTVPPHDWRSQIEGSRISPGRLYGAYRYQQPEYTANPVVDYNRRMRQGWVLGFFSLFHSRDPKLPMEGEPLFDIFWPHAGNYDTSFTKRWGPNEQTLLPIPMIHLGNEREHWTGRGNKDALHAEYFSKRPGLEQWQHERLKELPILGGSKKL